MIKGAMDRNAFDTYIEKVLAPELKPGTVVILDNLATHKSEKAAAALKAKEYVRHKVDYLGALPISASRSTNLAALQRPKETKVK